MKDTLNNILSQLDNQEGNSETLGYEALAVIKEILDKNPFDLNARVIRMRLNADIFNNTAAIIEEATFIIETDRFVEQKMVGYDWLFWVYDAVLSMPEKAIETIEEQLVEMQTLYDKKYIKDQKEGELLDKFAVLTFQNGDEDKALDLWYKSYKKYPYLDRNGYIGMLFLDKGKFDKAEELLLTHYNGSYDYEDGYRLKYGIKLKELYDAKKLDNYPTLIGLLFNIIRNEREHFIINGKLDFFEKYYPEIKKWTKIHPNNAFIWTAIAHTHLYDTKDYQKAFKAFLKLFECDKNTAFTSIKRIRKAAKKTKNKFFDLPFKFEGLSSDMYATLTLLFLSKAKNKKQKKKFIKLAIKYGEVGYNQYREYLFNGKGDTHNNQPHRFAMLCNNYALAQKKYADFFLKKEAKKKVYNNAGKIHLEGYKMSPFIENLENASSSYFKAENYKKALECSKQLLTDYQDELSVYDTQFQYWQIVQCYIKLNNLNEAERYYLKAKKLYLKVGKGAEDATKLFIFTAKSLFEFAVIKNLEYQKLNTEMQWYVNEKVAAKLKPKEHGLVSYYLGICYKENNETKKALRAFQITVDYLKNTNWDFYDEKYRLAKAYMKDLE